MTDHIIACEYKYDDNTIEDELYQIQQLVNDEELFPLLDDQFPLFANISEQNSKNYEHIQSIIKIENAISKNLCIQNLLQQYYHKLEPDIQITCELLKKLQKATKSLFSKQKSLKSSQNSTFYITRHLIGWSNSHPQRHWSWFVDTFEYSHPPSTLDSLQRHNRHSKYKTSIQIPVPANWTSKEKKMLMKLVEQYPNGNVDDSNLWEIIASIFSNSDFPRRHYLEYRDQWNSIGKCHSKISLWSEEEEKLLIELVKDTNRNWILVSERLKPRTVSECFMHYRVMSNKTCPIRRKWSKEEDEKLIQAVSVCGDRDWQQVASIMPEGRTGQQCMSRWTKSINPNIHHGKWTKEEDDRLIAIMNVFGGHSDDVKQKKWALISQLVPNRTDVQCRERWMNKLDPTLNEGTWTKEEDEKLLELVSRYGSSKWSWFSKHQPFIRRTDNQLRRRYRMLIQKKSI